MKKSRRYATRYTAKKRLLLETIASLNAQICHLTDRLAIADRERAIREAKEPGITVIRVGKAIPHFRSEIIAISVHIRVDELLYSIRRSGAGDAYNLTRAIAYHVRDVAHKLEAAIVEYAQAEHSA